MKGDGEKWRKVEAWNEGEAGLEDPALRLHHPYHRRQRQNNQGVINWLREAREGMTHGESFQWRFFCLSPGGSLSVFCGLFKIALLSSYLIYYFLLNLCSQNITALV